MIYSKTFENIPLIVDLLKEGKVAILPTDTVYGFSSLASSNPLSKKAEERIRKIKGREEKKPFIKLISFPDEIKNYTDLTLPPILKEKWPGKVTIIVPLKKELCLEEDTMAFRCPGDEWLRKVISLLKSPLYSTSVNKSGFPFLSRFSEIEASFGRDVDFLVDSGDLKEEPSTIVKLEGESFSIIRQGSVSF